MTHHHLFSSLPRIYCSYKLSIGDEISLELSQSHHLLHVLRLKTGDNLLVFNGNGSEYLATLAAINKKIIIIKIESFQQGIQESPLKIHLGQSIARGEKMDLIVQKAVELGVHEITPLLSDFCNVQLDHERLTKRVVRWQEIAVHASQQCGRCAVPKINAVQSLKQWSNQVNSELKLILSPAAKCSFNTIKNIVKNIAILIGPEGGFSAEEVDLAIETYNFIPLKLGPRILRTETAALAAISILQTIMGDF